MATLLADSIRHKSQSSLPDHDLGKWLSVWLQGSTSATRSTNSFKTSGRTLNENPHTKSTCQYRFVFLVAVNPQEMENLLLSFRSASRLSKLKELVEYYRNAFQPERALRLSDDFVTLLTNTKDRRIFAIQCVSQCKMELRQLQSDSFQDIGIAFEIHVTGSSKQNVLVALCRFSQIMSDLLPKTFYLRHMISSSLLVDQLPVRATKGGIWNPNNPHYGEMIFEDVSLDDDKDGGDVKSDNSALSLHDSSNSEPELEDFASIKGDQVKWPRATEKYYEVKGVPRADVKYKSTEDDNKLLRFPFQSPAKPQAIAPTEGESSLNFNHNHSSETASADTVFWKRMYEVVENCVDSVLSQRMTFLTASHNSSESIVSEGNQSTVEVAEEIHPPFRNKDWNDLQDRQDNYSLQDPGVEEASESNLTSFEDVEDNQRHIEFACQCDRASLPRENYIKRLEGKSSHGDVMSAKTVPITASGKREKLTQEGAATTEKQKRHTSMSKNRSSPQLLNVTKEKLPAKSTPTDVKSLSSHITTRALVKIHTNPTPDFPILKGSASVINFEINIQTKQGFFTVPFNCRTKELFRHTVDGQLTGRRMLQLCAEEKIQMSHISLVEMQKEGTHKASAYIRVKCLFEDVKIIDDVLQRLVNLVKA